MHRLPSFNSLWTNYPNGSPEEVKALIGGHVNATWIVNTCVIRLSYALNKSGFHIPSGAAGLTTVSGKDGLRYAFRVSEFDHFMHNQFGPPIKFGSGGSQTGIIMFKVHWADASGHFDLWDGAQCRHEGYFAQANGDVYLWPVP
jgi:hypothetical protein